MSTNTRTRLLIIALIAIFAASCKKKVPDLIGLTREEAAAKLSDSQLKVGQVTTGSGGGKAGTVVDQDPKPGAQAAKESLIALVLAQGGTAASSADGGTPTSPGVPTAGFTHVPGLTGSTLEQAEAALTAIGLVTGTIREEVVSTEHPAGKVFKTSPANGTGVASGSPVELYVASDSQALVPSVEGKPQGEAESILRSAGFTIGAVTEVFEGGTVGQVVRTAPSPPSGAPRGGPIELFVRRATTPEATKGRAIADANYLVAAIRASEPDGAQRTGFDIGMGVWQGHTADGPGKQAFAKSLTPAEQAGFADAATFSLQWNNNAEFAARGAAIAMRDPAVAAHRAKARGTPPAGISAALYWLGFDIATGIFGDPKLGAQGNTVIGTGSERIRATLGRDGQSGFNDSLAFNVLRR